jgi:hypothetical protein
LKIIPGRTIVLTKFNGGLLGLVAGTYKKRLEVETTNGNYTEEAANFIPIFQLRKKSDLAFHTPGEIIERKKTAIITGLRKKVVSLAMKNESLRDEKIHLKRRCLSLESELEEIKRGQDIS